MKKTTLFSIFSFFLFSCQLTNDSNENHQSNDVKVVGAMKDVMWKGQLGAVINLDSLSVEGTYGLGPESYLKGELLLLDGTPYVSNVISESEMLVKKKNDLGAPFFVYAQVGEWKEIELPAIVKSTKDIEQYLTLNYSNENAPYVFKLKGKIKKALIHIQNLPDRSVVTSPKEAHQGQVNYLIENEEVEIIGFYSTSHKGIFTHHDTNIHMHLITSDKSKMGHLDEVEINAGQMILYLPLPR